MKTRMEYCYELEEIYTRFKEKYADPTDKQIEGFLKTNAPIAALAQMGVNETREAIYRNLALLRSRRALS